VISSVLALRALTAEEVLGDDLSGQFALTRINNFASAADKDANSSKKIFMSICSLERFTLFSVSKTSIKIGSGEVPVFF
jgi:hypothetical protein